jgi:hypothetical protein
MLTEEEVYRRLQAMKDAARLVEQRQETVNTIRRVGECIDGELAAARLRLRGAEDAYAAARSALDPFAEVMTPGEAVVTGDVAFVLNLYGRVELLPVRYVGTVLHRAARLAAEAKPEPTPACTCDGACSMCAAYESQPVTLPTSLDIATTY